MSQPSPTPIPSLTTIDDDGARPGLFGLSVCTSRLLWRQALWIYSEQLVLSRVSVSPRRGQGMLVGWRLDGSKRRQARQAVHKMRAGAVCPAAMRAQTALRTTQLLCSADHAGRLPSLFATTCPWERNVGLEASCFKTRDSLPPRVNSICLCNVRGNVPPLHAQESSRLGVTETVLTAGFVLDTDGSNFGRPRE